MRIPAVLSLLALCALISAAAEPGFEAIFDGKTLNGWTLVGGKGPGYVVENGDIVCPADGGGDLFTEKEYANFVFRFAFRFEPGGNNGIGIRSPLTTRAAYDGMEIQILDHDHQKYQGWLKPVQRHGAVYDLIAPQADTLKPAGQWNEEEIRAEGKKITVTLNGKLINQADLSTITDPAVLKKHPGMLRPSGRIGLLGHGTRVEFRDLRVRVLR
jgi:hypothetical protein